MKDLEIGRKVAARRHQKTSDDGRGPLAVGPNRLSNNRVELCYRLVIDWRGLTPIQTKRHDEGFHNLAFGLPLPGETGQPGAQKGGLVDAAGECGPAQSIA